jgi:hypothetical protein
LNARTALYSRDTDLTGLWSGEYWYDAVAQRTPFTAHFIDTDGSLSGTTLEPATFGAGPGDLSAELAGVRGDLSVRFTKRYDPAPGVHRDPIFYDGVVDVKFTMIEGGWTLSSEHGRMTGRFVLVRVSRGVQAAEREVAEALEIRR